MFRPLLLALALALPATPAAAADPDVVIYGGTPGGIAAAIEAGKLGRRVVLVEPYRWVGGLVTNGLTHPDFRTFEALTGSYADLIRRVKAHYAKEHGPDSVQVKESLRGTQAEPKVNRLVLEQMLAEQKTVTVRLQTSLKAVETNGKRVVAATFAGPDGKDLRIAAPVFIDATYEGDLAAAAGATFRVGREGKAEFGETLAPDEPDGQVQGYNFRLTMTNVPENMAPVVAPPGYDRAEFVPVLALFADGRIKSVYGTANCVYKLQVPPLPNGKRDINDVSHSAVRLSIPEISPKWPTGTKAERDAVFAEHVRYNVGIIHFLQTDPEVPEKIRAEAKQWGWCKDEYPENAHLPEQLYVREARRIAGRYTFTEKDTDPAPNVARSVFRPDAIAMGDYGPNCHGTSHPGPRIGGKHAGEFYKPVMPYQIPYGTIVAKDFDNLLIPVPVSSSHVGFCALRLEPIWMSLGQAAGVAAALAANGDVAKVPVPAIRAKLHAAGGATIYVSDVPPESPDFAAVQWWGSLGGLHGLNPAPAKPGQRGKNIVGQYYEAYPGHAAELDKPLDAATRTKWLALAKANGVVADPTGAKTRGEFIRSVFAAGK